MLRSLHIENIAVIRTLELELRDGFTAMTGETGAGKSIIIDSINFLLGNRAARELVRSGESRAVVSAVFDGIDDRLRGELILAGAECEDGEISLERTLTTDGRSVCRVDGRQVTQAVLRRVGRLLVSIHGQNENGKLTDPSAVLEMLDAMAHTEGVLAEYKKLYSELGGVKSEIAGYCRDEKEKNQLRDMLEYQIKDISSLKLKPGEEERLNAEKRRLSGLERIKKQSDIALRAIYSNEKGITASYLLTRAAEALSKLADIYPEYTEYAERLSSCRYEADDIAAEIYARAEEAQSEDPTAAIDAAEARLDAIGKLKRRYGQTVEEIIKYRDDAIKRLAELDGGEDRLIELRERERELSSRLINVGTTLSELRHAAAAQAELGVAESLAFLDMPKVRFAIRLTPLDEPAASGIDRVELLISSNPGEPPMPLSRIASGGELARIMLSLKSVMSGLDGVPTLIYDEVDTGISGKTSRKVGIKLKRSARNAQVLCVTHSAQIASLADTHLLITKRERDGRSESTVEQPDDEGRVDEIARILGGINVTEAQRAAARELIAEGKTL